MLLSRPQRYGVICSYGKIRRTAVLSICGLDSQRGSYPWQSAQPLIFLDLLVRSHLLGLDSQSSHKGETPASIIITTLSRTKQERWISDYVMLRSTAAVSCLDFQRKGSTSDGSWLSIPSGI
ncbi:hypothetical protein PG994_001900 [Apiospora phragmitis]|uniref:Uncharacterized protein n=1 Tax=Apiospora phragmitis TaxID=2905665 RepID=A0ABR1WUU8_9PEZI